MAPPKLSLLPNLLRRTRRRSYHHRSLYSSNSIFTQTNGHDRFHYQNSSVHPHVPYHFSFTRFFSTNGDSASEDFNFDHHNSALTQPEFDYSQLAAVSTGGYEDSIFPVRALISLLDSYHDLTGFPWWIVIASSTLAMRLTLFPIIVLQLHKLKRIGELLPKLPPPLPPPMSGRSFRDQITLFLKEKRAVGCPSVLWFFASVAVQVPSFFLWITSIRRMSLNHHPGFESGGALWFQNLTEFPNGVLGPIFPLLIAGLHFSNVQISFQKLSVGKMPGLLGLFAKYYKYYLEILTLPILFITFNVPQGSLVYWLTNSSLSLVQQLVLNHPNVRKKLGLPDKGAAGPAANSEEVDKSEVPEMLKPRKQGNKVSAADLSPAELVNLSVKYLSEGNKDRARPLLRLALDKDSENIRASLIMGQILLQDGLPAEAVEYLERATSKLLLSPHPTGLEDVDLLILSSQWAGLAYIRQNKYQEGIVHLERLARTEEPEDSKSKAHYYDGLVLLSSALYNINRKVEAAKYLRMAAAYDSKFNYLLEQCENEEDDLVSDLVSSRRKDY